MNCGVSAVSLHVRSQCVSHYIIIQGSQIIRRVSLLSSPAVQCSHIISNCFIVYTIKNDEVHLHDRELSPLVRQFHNLQSNINYTIVYVGGGLFRVFGKSNYYSISLYASRRQLVPVNYRQFNCFPPPLLLERWMRGKAYQTDDYYKPFSIVHFRCEFM